MSPTPAPPTRGGPVTRLWKAAHRWRGRWYRSRSVRLPRPTLSIGNLHWGGTGKTPLVLAIADRLQREGRQVAVLSRGYGRRTRGPLVVSRGRGPETDPESAGDEPFLMAEELPAVQVVVGERRADAGRLALELDPTPDLFLLDDGFSHLALARDVDLLAVPIGDPWGRGTLPPRGRLREPPESAARAHGLLITGREVPKDSVAEIRDGYRRYGFSGEAFAAPTVPGGVREVVGPRLPPDAIRLLVTGIARPERVAETAKDLGVRIAEHLAFPDHHEYPEASLDRIARSAAASGARGVVTTTKDLPKLRSRLDLPLAVLPVAAEIEEGFWTWLDDLLDRAEASP